MRKISKTLKIVFCALFSCFIPIALCTWAIRGMIKEEQLKAEYKVNPFTEYVQNPTNGNVIFDDTLTTSGAYLGYDVSNDFSYDSENRVIDLGDPKTGYITISQNIHLGHANDSGLNYSADQFSNSGSFANDGSVGGGLTTPNSKYSTSRLYTIKLVSDVIINSGVTLSIGAFIGTTAQGMSGGIINGNFVCLDLNGHSLVINSGATLNAYGYIVDTKVNKKDKHIGEIENNGSIYTGFVVEDFHGGGATVGRGFASQMPFCLYSIPYISCKIKNNYGSYIYGSTMLFANGVMNKTILNWFGSDSNYFLQLNSSNSTDSLIIDTYNNPLSNIRKEYAEKLKSFYYFRGDFKQNSLKLTIKFEFDLGIEIDAATATIDMAQFNFYIPPYAKIYLLGANSKFEINMNLSFMPGASLYTESGSKIIFSRTQFETFVDVVVYGKQIISNGTSYGGIIALSSMPPSQSSSFSANNSQGETNYLYNFNSSDYQSYEVNEKEIYSSGNSRIIINGELEFNETSGNYFTLAGFMKLSDSAQEDLSNNKNAINCFIRKSENFGNVPGASQLVSWVTSQRETNPTDISYGGYIILPLVISNANNTSNKNLIGRVFSPSTEIDSGFSNDVYFDFRNGYFYDIAKNGHYIYTLSENVGTMVKKISDIHVNGNIVKLDAVDTSNHYVVYNGKIYLYFEDVFVPTDLISNINVTNINGLFVKSGDNYNEIINNKVRYAYDVNLVVKKYRGAQAQNRSNSSYRTHYQKQTAGKWHDPIIDGGKTYGEWMNKPNINGYLDETLGETNVGTQNKEATINIEYLSGEYLDEEKFNKQGYNNVELINFSQTKNSANYVLTNLKARVFANGEDVLDSLGERVEPQGVNPSNASGQILGKNDEYDITKESGFLGSGGERQRNEYYDWYHRTRDAIYVSGDYSESDVLIYAGKYTSGGSIRFNESTGLWSK